MKVGILTFHWAANHGAVLQTYATMKYLNENGCEAFVIDYCATNNEISVKNAIKYKRPSTLIEKIFECCKERKIAPFRKELLLTRRYQSNCELIDNPPEADVYITGSDQVWNPWYLMYGENRKITPVYYLNFGKPNVKRIAMSVSFGCTDYSHSEKTTAAPYLGKFDAVSVREQSGLHILKNMGIYGGIVTADPTALLTQQEYLNLCSDKPRKINCVVKCVLRTQSKEIKHQISEIIALVGDKNIINIKNVSIEDWLSEIRDAKIVITNSFHCIMMCLKLHTPFIAVLEDGAKAAMNDRIFTLLDFFGLRYNVYSKGLSFQAENDINWESIDILMENYSNTLKEYLFENVIDEHRTIIGI